MQRIITFLLVLFLQPCFSNTIPKFSVEPLGQNVISIPNNSFLNINYKITNNTKITRTLTYKHINGVIQNILGVGLCNSPFTLHSGESCILNLIAFDLELGAATYRGGPVVCKTTSDNDDSPSPFLCSQPASNQEIIIQQPTPEPGRVLCWGSNDSAEAGQPSGNPNPVDYPRSVNNSSNMDFLSTSAGRSFSCALTSNGGVKCWGSNGSGQLGNNSSSTTTNIPQQVSGLSSGVLQITSGGGHACALLANGSVQCWGLNGNGQLGNGTTANATTPTMVQNLIGPVVKVSANNVSTCALLASGSVKCWGRNERGELGIPTSTTQSSLPVLVNGLSGVVANITNGQKGTCALMNSGKVNCWGDNQFGQLGNGTIGGFSYLPVEVQGLTNTPVFLRSSGFSNCVIMSDKTAQCWGSNDKGQLGDGTIVDSPTPVVVVGLSNIADLRCSERACCALFEDGTAKCWGSNTRHQLANATNFPLGYSVNPVDLTTEGTTPLMNILNLMNIGEKFTWCVIAS